MSRHGHSVTRKTMKIDPPAWVCRPTYSWLGPSRILKPKFQSLMFSKLIGII